MRRFARKPNGTGETGMNHLHLHAAVQMYTVMSYCMLFCSRARRWYFIIINMNEGCTRPLMPAFESESSERQLATGGHCPSPRGGVTLDKGRVYVPCPAGHIAACYESLVTGHTLSLAMSHYRWLS